MVWPVVCLINMFSVGDFGMTFQNNGWIAGKGDVMVNDIVFVTSD